MRRELRYDDWDAVTVDLRRLADGYRQHGRWSLQQAARHLNDWLRFPMDGFPKPPWPIALMMASLRYTVGPSLFRKMLRTGKMQDRAPSVPETIYEPDPSLDEQAAVADLLATIERFRAHVGVIHASPVFGAMDREQAERLQFIHFAHHLSWLEPVEPK